MLRQALRKVLFRHSRKSSHGWKDTRGYSARLEQAYTDKFLWLVKSATSKWQQKSVCSQNTVFACKALLFQVCCSCLCAASKCKSSLIKCMYVCRKKHGLRENFKNKKCVPQLGAVPAWFSWIFKFTGWHAFMTARKLLNLPLPFRYV